LLFIYGAQVVQTLPGPHKSFCKWCTHLGGDVLQLDPLRLTMCLSLLDLVSKVDWKGKDGLGPCKTSTALRWESNSLQVHLCTLITFFTLSWRFWWGNGVKGPKLILFWCLMPKGEKIRPKQEMDQLPLVNFENSRVRVFVCQNTPICLLLSKVGLLRGEGLVFEFLINFSWNISLYISTSVFDLEIGNWVWFAKTNQVVAKNDPYMSNLNQNNSEFSFVLILHFL
jgi:hypothetical protein